MNKTGYLYNSKTGDVWCGSVFGWMPMPSVKALEISEAEAQIRIGIEMTMGAQKEDYLFRLAQQKGQVAK